MNELLTKDNIYYRDLAREIAEKHIRPIAAELDRTGEYPWSVIKALQEAELMGMWIPKDFGGRESGLLNLCIMCEELSRVCGGIGCTYVVNALGSLPIILGGTEEQKKKYLPDIAAGKNLIAFALSEKEAGSDAGSLSTKAERAGDNYVIDGDKKWTTNGAAATIFTVFATVNRERGTRGVTGFIVERGDARLRDRQARRPYGHSLCAGQRNALQGLPRSRRSAAGWGGRTGLQARDDDSGCCAALCCGSGVRHRAGRARSRAGIHQEQTPVRPIDRVLPGHSVHACGHGYAG